MPPGCSGGGEGTPAPELRSADYSDEVAVPRGRRGRTPSPSADADGPLPLSGGALTKARQSANDPLLVQLASWGTPSPCFAWPISPFQGAFGRQSRPQSRPAGGVNPTTTPLRGAVPLPLQGRFGRCAPSNAACGGVGWSKAFRLVQLLNAHRSKLSCLSYYDPVSTF